MKSRIKVKLLKARLALLEEYNQQVKKQQLLLHKAFEGAMEEISVNAYETLETKKLLERFAIQKFIKTSDAILASL